jgi:hypothetical protein
MGLHNGEAEPKSVHRTVESVYIKEEIVQSDPDDEVRIFFKKEGRFLNEHILDIVHCLFF